MERLRELYMSGNMTKEKYLVALKKLKGELKTLSKTSEKLGQLMQELTKELKEAVKMKVERLREVNREFGQRVSEEARRIGEEMRERAWATPRARAPTPKGAAVRAEAGASMKRRQRPLQLSRVDSAVEDTDAVTTIEQRSSSS
jgi:hypothetical protein